MAKTAVAINLVVNLIVASPTTRRDHQNLSAGLFDALAHVKQRIA
jgi:hypothetical protein